MWSEALAKISTESINTILPLLNITWTKTDFNVTGYRVTNNEFPAGTLTIEGKATGIEISGNIGSPWGYISAVYMDLNEKLVTLVNPSDILNDVPPANQYLELISINYDGTPQQDFHFTAHADWEELDPITSLPLGTGTDTFTFFYTVLNDWTGNKSNLDSLMNAKRAM